MATATITIADSSATDHTFNLQASDLKIAKYVESESTPKLPLGLEISHDMKPAGQDGTDRHIVKIFNTVEDANGKINTPVVSLQFSVPRNTAVTDTVLADAWAYVKAYVDASGTFDLLIDGVTP